MGIMKPPLTVEAKVAEELRTWLASELDHLDASNTNQFAHHVVTIFLKEDLDIEDDPLSSDDDFLKDIYSIKQGKTVEKQKRAAVQFLQGAVCCEDPVESEIQDVVDELLVRIERTKIKMNAKKVIRRGLLEPININIEEPNDKKLDRNESREEKYNEAFPSLSGEDSPHKDGLLTANGNTSVWNSSQHGKENLKVKTKKKIDRLRKPRRSFCFGNRDEAQACSVAMKVAAKVIPQHCKTTPESAEAGRNVGSFTWSLESSRCWSSAFIPNLFTKIFVPRAVCLVSPLPEQEGSISFKRFTPQIINGDDFMEWEVEDVVGRARQTLFDSFIPILDWEAKQPFVEMASEDDIEVETIFLCAKLKEEQQRKKLLAKKNAKQYEMKMSTKTRTFPDHFGTFWQKMIETGQIALYPKIEEDKDYCMEISEQEESMQGWSLENGYNTDGADSVASFYPEGDLEDSDSSLTMDVAIFEETPSYTNWTTHMDDGPDESTLEVDGENVTSGLNFLNHEDSKIDDQLANIENYQLNYLLNQSLEKKDLSKCDDDNDYNTESLQKINLAKSECSAGRKGLWSASTWDNIQQDFVTELQFHQRMSQQEDTLLPPMLSSCVPNEVHQFLERAFVNSYFSEEPLKASTFKEDKQPLNCLDVEQYLYSGLSTVFSEKIQSQEAKVVRGDTCSSWLENNCRLGLCCPFSHPSI